MISAAFRLEGRIVRPHVSLEAVRLETGALPHALHERMRHVQCFASERVDQCVAPLGGGFRVQFKMRASICGVRRVGFEPWWRPHNPASRSDSKRVFHFATVAELQPNAAVTSVYEAPSASSSTARARCARSARPARDRAYVSRASRSSGVNVSVSGRMTCARTGSPSSSR